MNMKSDEEKLKELFDIQEKPNFNKIIKRAKIFSIIRTTIVSLIIFIIVSFVVFISNATILNKMSNKEQEHLSNYFNISMPNAYIGSIQSDDRIMVGEIDYVRYRFLGNKPITDGNYKDGEDKFGHIHANTDWRVGLQHGEKIGLGTEQYELVVVK